MCSLHWRLVPLDLQKAVWAAYATGQEIRKDPSPEYLAAAAAAIDAVDEARKALGLSWARTVEECVLVRTENGSPAGPLFAPKKET